MVTVLVADDHALMRRAVREVLAKEGDLEVIAEACNGLDAVAQAQEFQPDVILMDLDMPGCDGFEATERALACSPTSRIIIFTAAHHEFQLLQALQRGAIGYITKDVEPDALVHAIRCAARNDLCIPASLAAPVVAHLRATWQAKESTPWLYLHSQNHFLAALSPFDNELGAYPAGGIDPSSTTFSYRISATPETVTNPSQSPSDPPATSITRPLTGREREILDLMRKGRKNREIAGELCIAESTVHKHVQNIFEKLHARNRTEAIYLSNTEGGEVPL